jgi:hypothetical protein
MGSVRDSSQIAKQLLALGAEVVTALKDNTPEALDRIDEYTNLFDQWQRSWSKIEKGQLRLSAKDQAIGKRIADQHSTVLELTEKMYRSVEESLRGVRGRSKGIRAYLDHFPSKISTIRTRKG